MKKVTVLPSLSQQVSVLAPGSDSPSNKHNIHVPYLPNPFLASRFRLTQMISLSRPLSKTSFWMAGDAGAAKPKQLE